MPEPEFASDVSDVTPIDLLPTLPRWQVWLVVAGFPAVYWLNSFTPWSIGLFVDGDRGYGNGYYGHGSVDTHGGRPYFFRNPYGNYGYQRH